MPAPSQLFRGGPTRHAMLNMGLICPHTGPKRCEITEASLTSLSACATTMPYSLFFSFSPALASPLRSRVLGFLSHDGFIGGPLLKRFHFSPDPFSLVLSAAWHIKGDLWVIEPWTQNIKLSACLAASKQQTRPHPSHHLPSSSFKWQEIVSLSYKCILKAFNF